MSVLLKLEAAALGQAGPAPAGFTPSVGSRFGEPMLSLKLSGKAPGPAALKAAARA